MPVLMKFINLITILFLPFLMLGIIKKTKAFWGGRKGASIFQPLYDFIKLIKKDFVISETTSFVFALTPLVSVACAIMASFFVPLCFGSAIVNIEAGIVVFAYILGLSKFFSLIGAMDTGSSFEGMGASREACFSAIVEPAFFMIIASVMALSGNYTFDALSKIVSNAGSYGGLIVIFAVLALFLMVLIEGCRVPVDDPATHLELTMIHEVMILDNSASDLAFISYAASLKMLLISSLIAKLIIPESLAVLEYFLCYLLIIFVISIIIGTLESSMARLRMSHVFEFIFIMSSFALIILSLTAARVFGG